MLKKLDNNLLMAFSVCMVVLSFSFWILTMLLLVISVGSKLTYAILFYIPVVLNFTAFLMSIFVVVKSRSIKESFDVLKLKLFLAIIFGFGSIFSLFWGYGFIHLERMGNSQSSTTLVDSPDQQYEVAATIGSSRDFWGKWENFYMFQIVEPGLNRTISSVILKDINFSISEEKIKKTPEDLKEDWNINWAKDSSEAVFESKEIKLILKVSEEEK